MCAESQSDISTEELFDFLFCEQEGTEHLAMLYQAYIDDSADRNRERVVIAGAIVGTKNEWGMVNGKWKTRLKQDKLQYFKSSDCESLNGQFHKFRRYGMAEGKRLALAVRDDLYDIIKHSPVISLGVTLSVPFHRRMVADPATFGAIPAVPYRLAFQQLLAECGKAILLLGNRHAITFGHDDGDDFAELHRLFKEFKALNPTYDAVMRDFVPLDDRFHPPAQAADVAAWVTYQAANEYVVTHSHEVLKRIGGRMYKIVNWLDQPYQVGSYPNPDEAPATAVYAV